MKKKKQKTKRQLIDRIIEVMLAFGFGFMMTCTAVLTLTFYVAYSSPDKSAVITVNDFGEGNIESFVMAFGFFCALLFLHFLGHVYKIARNKTNEMVMK